MSTRFHLSMEMSRLTRNGTAEPVSRDQILRRERGQVIIHFLVQLTTSRIGNLTRLILTLAIGDDHTYMRRGSWTCTTCPFHTNSVCVRERHILIGPW